MQPTAAAGEICNPVTASNRRTSLHEVHSTSGKRGDGDIWVAVVKAGNKAGSGVGKLMGELSTLRSRKDTAVAVDSE